MVNDRVYYVKLQLKKNRIDSYEKTTEWPQMYNVINNLDTVTLNPWLQQAPIYRRNLFEPRTPPI
jgi:hypothetical protein